MAEVITSTSGPTLRGSGNGDTVKVLRAAEILRTRGQLVKVQAVPLADVMIVTGVVGNRVHQVVYPFGGGSHVKQAGATAKGV